MLYLCAHWFEPDGSGHTAAFLTVEDRRELRLRFHTDQMWSNVADELTELHRIVLPGGWVETALDSSGRPTGIFASTCLWRHWRYALDPDTMIFHHRRLASVFCSPDGIPTLWINAAYYGGDVGHRTQTVSWRAQRKACRIITANARRRWLKAVRVILLCGFNNVTVTSMIVDLLEEWHKRDTSGRFTYARYALDEAVEEALSYTSNKRRKLP
jgi:hypothetical protein